MNAKGPPLLSILGCMLTKASLFYMLFKLLAAINT